MSFSYDPTNIQVGNVSWARLILGDTDELNNLLQDEEIEFFTNADTNLMLVNCAEAMLRAAQHQYRFRSGMELQFLEERIPEMKRMLATWRARYWTNWRVNNPAGDSGSIWGSNWNGTMATANPVVNV